MRCKYTLQIFFCLMGISVLCEKMFAQEIPVLFTTQKEGRNDELMMIKNGKSSQLTSHLAKDSSPKVSADGELIVFTSERKGWWKIWLYNLVPGDITQLTNSTAAEYSPDFSPNGDQIVFTSGRRGRPDLFIMNIDGSQIRNLTNTEASEGAAFWATDGFIYYATNESGKYQLQRIKPDGTDKELLSDGQSDDLDPELSPDETRLVYYSYRFGNPEICTMNLKDKTINRLTNNTLQDIRPSWSADGSKIVFERGNKKDNQQIYIMNSDGTGQQQLTFKGYNYAPTFAANDRFLKKRGF